MAAKALGIHWDSRRDTLRVSVPTNDIPEVSTKRTVASQYAQVYDVLGLYSPIPVKAKILLQKLWKEKLGWDEPLPSHLLSVWNSWLADLNYISEHELPRRLVPVDRAVVLQSLHGFADASSVAYGVVVYLRTVYILGN